MRSGAMPGRAACGGSGASWKRRAKRCGANLARSHRSRTSPRGSEEMKRVSAERSCASTPSNRRRRCQPATTWTTRRCRARWCPPSRSHRIAPTKNSKFANGGARVPSEPIAPDRAYEELEVRERVRAAIASLPPRERKVVGLYYYAEATMKQIGAEIGVNESRVSQLHARAIQRLKKSLGAECSMEEAAKALRPAILSFQQTMMRMKQAKAAQVERRAEPAVVLPYKKAVAKTQPKRRGH